MKIAVIIATYGRKATVSRLLEHIERQTVKPEVVVLSAPDETHVEPYAGGVLQVRTVFGRRGLCAQRNLGLEAVAGTCDIVVFFDDDFLPADSYLAELRRGFQQNPGWAVMTGTVLADGINGPGLSFEDGFRILDDAKLARALAGGVVDLESAYGCNMAMRAAFIGPLRFDERLALYGWQEDVDFTTQMRRRGRVVRVGDLQGVHLGVKGGRVSGVRFGYSQIVNPIYLLKKGTISSRAGLSLMARNVMANVAKCLWPEPHVDRLGRLRGNLLGAWHLLRGRIEPEHILHL